MSQVADAVEPVPASAKHAGAADRISRPAWRLLASGLPAGVPALRGGAGGIVRGSVRRGPRGPRRARDDPDRQFDRRPGRRHPSSDAALRSPDHRRAFPAGESSPAGAAGRPARGHQDRALARPCPEPMPPPAARARPHPEDPRRHRRRRRRGRRGPGGSIRRRSPRAWRPRSTASRSCAPTSRTPSTTPRASSSSRARRASRRPTRAR